MTERLELLLCDLESPEGARIPVEEVRARDATGSFAILPGHADFVACLVPSLVEWREPGGRRAFAGVPGGILRVVGGRCVEILGRRVYRGDSAAAVASSLADAMHRDSAAAEGARHAIDRLEAEIVGNLVRRKSGPQSGTASP